MKWHQEQIEKLTAQATAAYVAYASEPIEWKAADHLAKAEWLERAIAKHRANLAEMGAAVAAKAEKPRCEFAPVIREFFATAGRLGFDVSKAGRDRSRGALGQLLGKRIESRGDMSGQDWGFALTELRAGRLTAW
jgi:hypothetical protein